MMFRKSGTTDAGGLFLMRNTWAFMYAENPGDPSMKCGRASNIWTSFDAVPASGGPLACHPVRGLLVHVLSARLYEMIHSLLYRQLWPVTEQY